MSDRKPDQWQRKAAKNLRERHMDAARRAAEHIQEYIGYTLRDLERGEIPRYSVTADAQKIDDTARILEALRELTAIYETADGG